MEHNGHGQRHGGSDEGVIATIEAAGFARCNYDFGARTLTQAGDADAVATSSLNAIYVRSAVLDGVRTRLSEAPVVTLAGGRSY